MSQDPEADFKMEEFQEQLNELGKLESSLLEESNPDSQVAYLFGQSIKNYLNHTTTLTLKQLVMKTDSILFNKKTKSKKLRMTESRMNKILEGSTIPREEERDAISSVITQDSTKTQIKKNIIPLSRQTQNYDFTRPIFPDLSKKHLRALISPYGDKYRDELDAEV